MSEFIKSVRLNEADIMQSILNSYFIVDYGYINKVNPDKTVNVTHAIKPTLDDGTELPETTTDNVEVLTLCGQGFSLNWDYKANDKVLLLGLKDYIPKVEKVEQASSPKAYAHYSRTTLKAIPLCIFSDEAKVKVAIENGKMTIDAEDSVLVNAKKKIELNGNTKQFVTWAELNTALTQYVSLMSAALLGATYVNTGGSPTPLAWTAGTPPATLDISSSKTQTVVTGG